MKNFTCLTISLLLLGACHKQEKATDISCEGFDLHEPDAIDPEEYAVLSAFLGNEEESPFVIQQYTYALDSSAVYHLTKDTLQTGEVDSLVLESYIEANTKKIYWDNLFEGSSQLISEDELNCYSQHEERYWELYYQNHKEGYWMLSRPGISGDTALFEYAYYCNLLCAQGGYVQMKKVNGQWVIHKRGINWVS